MVRENFAPLPRTFAARDPVVVARALLGAVLVHEVDGVARAGRIVETEAYLGPHDLACHSAKGRTARTEVMFGPPGHAYVYLIYGMHHCFNVVVGGGAAVLVRALEPICGIAAGVRTDGPGRLTRVLGIDKRRNAHPLDAAPLYLAPGERVARGRIGVSARIGVDYAEAWASAPLRFFVQGAAQVSRAPRAQPM